MKENNLKEESQAVKMQNVPKRIFLLVGDDIDNIPDDFKKLDTAFVYWCEHRMNDKDIEYILASEAVSATSLVQEGKGEALYSPLQLRGLANTILEDTTFYENNDAETV